jgi:hypothetical protein
MLWTFQSHKAAALSISSGNPLHRSPPFRIHRKTEREQKCRIEMIEAMLYAITWICNFDGIKKKFVKLGLHVEEVPVIAYDS